MFDFANISTCICFFLWLSISGMMQPPIIIDYEAHNVHYYAIYIGKYRGTHSIGLIPISKWQKEKQTHPKLILKLKITLATSLAASS